MIDPYYDWAGCMTKISNVLDEEKESVHEDECEVDELQIAKLRKLVKTLKMKTLIGEENVDEIVNKVSDDEIYQRFHDLQIMCCEMLDERDLLENTLKQSKEIAKEMQETLLDKETKAKNEKSVLKKSGKPKENSKVETNEKLIEEFHRLNLASGKKDKKILELKEDLAEAQKKIQDLKRDHQAMSCNRNYYQNCSTGYHDQNRFSGGFSQNYIDNRNSAHQFGSFPGLGNYHPGNIKFGRGGFINQHAGYFNHHPGYGSFFSYNGGYYSGYNFGGYQSYMYQSRNRGYQKFW